MLDIVETEGIETVSFLDILPNPTVDMVNAATKVYKESGATSIVALGGGSRWMLPSGRCSGKIRRIHYRV